MSSHKWPSSRNGHLLSSQPVPARKLTAPGFDFPGLDTPFSGIEITNSSIESTNSCIEFTSSGIEFTNSGVEFTNLGFEFTNSSIEFTDSGIEFIWVRNVPRAGTRRRCPRRGRASWSCLRGSGPVPSPSTLASTPGRSSQAVSSNFKCNVSC